MKVFLKFQSKRQEKLKSLELKSQILISIEKLQKFNTIWGDHSVAEHLLSIKTFIRIVKFETLVLKVLKIYNNLINIQNFECFQQKDLNFAKLLE